MLVFLQTGDGEGIHADAEGRANSVARREGGGTGEEAAGLKPIRPGEAYSTCTVRPPGRVSVTR